MGQMWPVSGRPELRHEDLAVSCKTCRCGPHLVQAVCVPFFGEYFGFSGDKSEPAETENTVCMIKIVVQVGNV